MKRKIILTLTLASALLLCSCAAQAVSASPVSSTVPTAAVGQAEIQSTAAICEEFTNTAGDINFRIDGAVLEELPASMPVLKVKPETITIDMAKTVAAAIFGESTLYEYTEKLTRAEIKEMIAALEYGVTESAIREDYGEDASDDVLENVRRGRQEILDYYRSAYEYADDEVTSQECLWRFWPLSHYSALSQDYAGTDVSYADDIPFGVSANLMATATMDGLPYKLWVGNYERGDFRNHSIDVCLIEPTPQDAAYGRWMRNQRIYSDTEASRSELSAALDKAKSIASHLNMGQWELDATVIQGGYQVYDFQSDETTQATGYQIHISGKPLYSGVPLLLSSGATDYYDEALNMDFTNDGRLTRFELISPHEVTVTEPSVPIIGRDEALSLIKGELAGLTAGTEWEKTPYAVGFEAAGMEIDITDISVGLARTQLDSAAFELTPTVTVSGICTAYDSQGENISAKLMDAGNIRTLLILDIRSN